MKNAAPAAWNAAMSPSARTATDIRSGLMACGSLRVLLVGVDLEFDAAGSHVIVITEHPIGQRVITRVQLGCRNTELRGGLGRQTVDFLRRLTALLYRQRRQRRGL